VLPAQRNIALKGIDRCEVQLEEVMTLFHSDNNVAGQSTTVLQKFGSERAIGIRSSEGGDSEEV
jgi:hypothetical protein